MSVGYCIDRKDIEREVARAILSVDRSERAKYFSDGIDLYINGVVSGSKLYDRLLVASHFGASTKCIVNVKPGKIIINTVNNVYISSKYLNFT